MDTLEKLIKSLTGNPWFSFSGWFLTFLAIPLAVLFYLKGKKDRKPCYLSRSVTIIERTEEMIPGLSVHFSGHGEPLSNFTVTRLAFWNAGRETIRKDDVAKTAPLTIVPKDGCLLLGIETLFSEPANQFDVSINRAKTAAGISFTYVDKDQGIVLQIAHTGVSGSDMALAGTFIGAKPLVRLSVPFPISILPRLRNTNRRKTFEVSGRPRLFRALTVIFFGIVFMVAGFLTSIRRPDVPLPRSLKISLGTLVA